MEIYKSIKVQVSSEIGELEAVIVHNPGQEVENMTIGHKRGSSGTVE